MLPPFNQSRNVFVEITKSEHNHGGKGWEFGTCLWSPEKNKVGADRYSLMRKPQKGDLVLHFYDDKWSNNRYEMRLCGFSLVKQPVNITEKEPPSPGNWGGRGKYYRIELRDYTSFKNPLPLATLISEYKEELRQELTENQPYFYPFNTYGDTIQTVQGIYLAQVTERLFEIISKALGIEAVKPFLYENPKPKKQIKERQVEYNPHEEYTEYRRRAAEKYFFVRNPKLTRLAKEKYGAICHACQFDFEKKYGSLGKDYIEVHHRDPLSERAEGEWSDELKTKVDDVITLCSNCHRMIHRKRPALTIEELIQALKEAEQ